MDLKGKAAIVTGAGTGVGRSTALALAEQGCDVIVNYSRSQQAAEQVAKDARALGVKALTVQADVADDDACRKLVDAATKAFGRLDVLVNNAGTTSFIPHADLASVGDETWESIMGVNLKGPFQCTRAALDALKADGGGHVVMVSSVAGVYATGSSIPYCASKAALNNLTVALARVLGPEVQVNAICPGFIDGDWLKRGFGDAYPAIMKSYQERALLGRVCNPDEVSAAILSLLQGSALLTGEIIVLDGGAGKAY